MNGVAFNARDSLHVVIQIGEDVGESLWAKLHTLRQISLGGIVEEPDVAQLQQVTERASLSFVVERQIGESGSAQPKADF